MPYIDTDRWFEAILEPLDGEKYAEFTARCLAGIKSLRSEIQDDYAMQLVDSAWAAFIMKQASEVTVTIKREFMMNTVYADGYWTDWKVTEIHSATTPMITYSAIEKAKAVDGDSFRIAKSVDEKQIVFGWANIAKDADGNYPLDWDGDVTSPEELENAAYTFVLKYRATGEKHEGDVKGQLVESVMLTKEKQQALGIPSGLVPEGWWVGFHVPDADVFAKIKSGEYEMFSVQGKAKRVPTGQ